MERQIKQIKQEIEQIKVSNKELQRNVTLNGLDTCKGDGLDEVPDLEYDKIQIDLRLVNLQKKDE